MERATADDGGGGEDDGVVRTIMSSLDDGQLFELDATRENIPEDTYGLSASHLYDYPPTETGHVDILGVPSDRPARPRAAAGARGGAGACFNCLGHDHALRMCPYPRNDVSIARNRDAFREARGARMLVHAGLSAALVRREPAPLAADATRCMALLNRFRPGIVSANLEAALGETGGEMPWCRNMLLWGYPPGWEVDAASGRGTFPHRPAPHPSLPDLGCRPT